MIEIKDKHGKVLTKEEVVQKIINRIQNIFLEFLLMILRWVGHIPSRRIRKLCYQISGMSIGKGSVVHMWCNFFNPKNITIGEDTIIGDHAFLDGRASLTIGSHTELASSVMIYNSQHDIDDEYFRAVSKPVRIGDYVFIGPRAIILPGVTIHNGAIVGAGAVVTKDVAESTLVGGVPAREIRKRKIKTYRYKLGRAKMFQ